LHTKDTREAKRRIASSRHLRRNIFTEFHDSLPPIETVLSEKPMSVSRSFPDAIVVYVLRPREMRPEMRNESLDAGELSKKLSKSLLLGPFVLARKFSARAFAGKMARNREESREGLERK